ncbi:MAG: hypothetical protein AAGG57_12105 [Pseudomonadota bacterium]
MKQSSSFEQNELRRLKKKPLPPLAKIALPLSAGFSATLFTLATPDLIGADSFLDYCKAGVLGLSGGFSGYTVARFALEKGAFQAAIGSLPAALISTTSMIAVGSALFLGTYGGLVLDETDRLRMQAYANHKAAWLQQQSNVAQSSLQAVPVYDAFLDDLGNNVVCEGLNSCVSGIGSGGEGDVYRKLSGVFGQAQAVASEIASGREAQSSALGELSNVQAGIQGLLNDSALSPSARRAQIEQLAQNASGLLNSLQQASPGTLIASLARQLMQQDGIAPEDRLLQSYGAQLMRALPDDAAFDPPPSFPQPTGVWDTLRYFGFFLPVGLILMLIEVAVPLCLWLYTFIFLRIRVEEIERDTAKATPRKNYSRTRKTGGSNEQA